MGQLPMLLLLLSTAVGVGLTAACSAGDDPPARDSGLPDAGETGPGDADADSADGDIPVDADHDGEDADADSGDADSDDDADAPPDSPPELRGIVHAHTVYSHDGCDEHGVPDDECTAQLRAAACELGLDFVALTDHPSNMRDYPFEDLLLFDDSAGDELVMDDGEPIGNRVACGDGRTVLLTVGYEDQHSMPLGLHNHLPTPEDYVGLTDSVPMDVAQDWVETVRAAGAVATLVHSEGDDISAAYVDEAGLEAMEWYNIHASIEGLLGADAILGGDPLDLIDTLAGLNSYMLGSPGTVHPDLIGLLVMRDLPPQGFEKWRAIQRGRHITGILGTDIHRNVSVEPVCSDGIVRALCEAAARLYPHVLTLLVTGGPIMLSDGERLDSYRRVMSWLENRVLAPEATPEAIAGALRGGRSYGLFTVFGDAPGFGFVARAGEREVEMGGEVAAPATLVVRLPLRPSPLGRVSFGEAEADRAEIRAELVRTDATGSAVVLEAPAGAPIEHAVSTPGAYHVEVFVRPLHLEAALGPEGSQASREYLWIITNPIRVLP